MPTTTAAAAAAVSAAKKASIVQSVKPKKGNKSATNVDDDIEEWKKSKQLAKPKDQLELLDYELKEVIPRLLTSTNPKKPDSIVEFNHAVGEFVLVPPPSLLLVVYQIQGNCLYKYSEEARQQLIEQGIDPATLEEEFQEEQEVEDFGEEIEQEVLEEIEAEEEGIEEEEGVEPEAQDEADRGEDEGKAEGDEEPVKTGKPKKLTNQFNFCERAALTYNNPFRSQETQTIPPPMATFSSNVLQWVIYDGYLQDYAAQQLEKEKERERKEKDKLPVSRTRGTKKVAGRSQLSEAIQGRVYECWKVLERMVNQNKYDDVAKDYRYWEDPSDEYRDEEGTLLPLWKYSYEKTKKNTVTDISWNPWYYDLFAVCFGFLDFMKPMPGGAVCLFTIKNPSYPEQICITQSGVMCVDIHPRYPYMVVVGLYDGAVCVFNVQASCKKPAFQSDSVANKHSGIVWEIKWGPDLSDGDMNFFSVAIDGRINNWVLMQNDLSVTTIINLYLERDSVPGPDGTLVKMKSCASCVIFHPKDAKIYLVGTEEGLIYKCSTEYSSMYLLTYHAHHMPVYRIDFNKYNSDIFISCSEDWRIKVWEDNRLEPLFVFDVGACVGDVQWAPYSSTVFAAVTAEGKVYVYDLNVNKYKPMCIQAIVSRKKNKLTRIAFNHKMPIIVVGDDKGTITSLKLSPNLRIPCKPPKKQQYLDQWTLQCMKLDKLLSLVREPMTLTIPEDTNSSTS